MREHMWTRERERRRRRRRRRKRKKHRKKSIRFLHSVSTMWCSNKGREARGKRVRGSPQAGKRERFTCTFYLDICQTRQLQSDRERKKERQ